MGNKSSRHTLDIYQPVKQIQQVQPVQPVQPIFDKKFPELNLMLVYRAQYMYKYTIKNYALEQLEYLLHLGNYNSFTYKNTSYPFDTKDLVYFAAMFNKLETVKYLVGIGIPVNDMVSEVSSFLNYVEIIKYLKDNKLNISEQAVRISALVGNSEIFFYIFNNTPGIITDVVSYGFYIGDFPFLKNYYTRDKSIPYLKIIPDKIKNKETETEEKIKILKYLITKGFSDTHTTYEIIYNFNSLELLKWAIGHNCLICDDCIYYAIVKNNFEIVDYLFKINAPVTGGELHIAITNNNFKIVKYLVENNFPISDNLVELSLEKNVKITEYLIKKGGKYNINTFKVFRDNKYSQNIISNFFGPDISSIISEY